VEVWDNPSWNKTEIARATVGWPALNPPLVAFTAWSPDAAHLAFATSGGPLQVWDVNANRLLYTYPSRNGQVNNIAWSPDGTHIALANADGTVQILPVPNATTVNEHLPH
jgi:WD40 repeat protein